METEGLTLEFSDDAIREIARIAAEVNRNVENIGARRLHTILTTLLEHILFEAPDNLPIHELLVDGAMVNERLSGIAKDRDLSQFIL
jgi:ATP-dependent HslUV protease ATP-binding subunit HslU